MAERLYAALSGPDGLVHFYPYTLHPAAREVRFSAGRRLPLVWCTSPLAYQHFTVTLDPGAEVTCLVCLVNLGDRVRDVHEVARRGGWR